MNNNRKGSRRLHSRRTFTDSHTGRTIRKLTSNGDGDGHFYHHPYFYNRIFTSDSRELIVASRAGGEGQLHALNLESGEALQLTDGPGIHAFSANLSLDDRLLYFVRGASIIRLDMKTLREEIVYTTPVGWVAYDNPGLSANNEYIVTVEMKAADRIESHGGWSVFEEQWAARPHCRIIRIHLASGRSETLHEENGWLGHPQLRPGDNDLLMYCHEGPSHRVDARVWLLGGEGPICARPQIAGEMVSHEYWHPDGSAIAYVYRQQAHEGLKSSAVVDPETYRPLTEQAELRQQIRLLDPETLAETTVMDCSSYCHFISNNDHTLIVGDGQTQDEGYIYLADPIKRTETVLCEHGTSWRSYGTTQDAHPHPVFAQGGRSIVFTSDRDGLPGVYMVDI